MTQTPPPADDSKPGRDEPPAELLDWNVELSAALNIPRADVNRILSLAGVAAHRVVRPAAPVTTFLVGYATAQLVAKGSPVEEAFERATACADALIAAHSSRLPEAE